MEHQGFLTNVSADAESSLKESSNAAVVEALENVNKLVLQTYRCSQPTNG
jgi:hypothetical protein